MNVGFTGVKHLMYSTTRETALTTGSWGAVSRFLLIPSLKLTATAPENGPLALKGNDRIPTIHFQVRAVSFGVGSF